MQKANFDEEEERSKIFVWNKKAFERAILFIANTQAVTDAVKNEVRQLKSMPVG